jgi:glycerol uptake facilitator-like aquaporin
VTDKRALAAEFIGTAFLLLAVVGSGIMAQRLCGGNPGLALLANALATGAALIALILAFGPVSGAHFNPAVTLAIAMRKNTWNIVAPYITAQVFGALAGTALANVMFGLPALTPSHHERSGTAMIVSEFIATFGLLAVILGCARSRPTAVPYAVAAYIVGAYWFTPSTSFANPAVTLARSLTDTFSGIRPLDVPAFVAAQVIATMAAVSLFGWLETSTTENVVAVAQTEAA